MADIDLLNPVLRRFIVVRRPDAPTQTRIEVLRDSRVALLNGNVERTQVLEKEIAGSADLLTLLKVSATLKADHSWRHGDVAAARKAAEILLTPAGSPVVVVEQTPPFADGVLALAGTALYLARQGRPLRSPPYLDAVFFAWLFKNTTPPKGKPSEIRDQVVFVWGALSHTPNPDVRPNPDLRPLPTNVDSLRREATSARSMLHELFASTESRSAPLSVNALTALRGAAPTLVEHFGTMPSVADALTFANTVITLPQTPSTPEPVLMGVHVGDLFVTRARLAGYQIADISRIEPVLGTETRERTHTRRTLVESDEKMEEEQTRETESDLEQTSRDELRTEQRKQEETEAQLSAGGRVSASFGTFMTVEAHADVSTKSSKSVAETVARTTSTETMRKAVDRARSRLLRQLSSHRLEEVIEQNKHSFVSAGKDRQGFYRWLEKRIEVTLLSLGSRTIYTFGVEDPSASFRAASVAALPPPPSPPMIDGHFFPLLDRWIPARPLAPTDITRDNYIDLLAQHEADEGLAPPPESQTVSVSLAAATKDGSATQKDVDIPDGYACYRIEGKIEGAIFEYTDDAQTENQTRNKNGFVSGIATIQTPAERETTARTAYHAQPSRKGSPVAQVVVAGHSKQDGQQLTLDAGTTHFPKPLGPKVSVAARSLGDFAVDVTFYCELLDEVFASWRLDTYRAIMAGYAARRAKYEETITAMTRTSVEIAALRAEIKRLALRGVVRGTTPPLAVRLFLEQAFDWNNMAYQFIDGENPPTIAAPSGSALGSFLRAIVARIDLAVNPGFEGLVAAYMQGPADVVPDNPVSEEGGTGLDAALEAPIHMPKTETVVETWIELLPTDLVFVQSDKAVTDIYDAEGNRWQAP
ncbi:MAG: hypothetical protein ABMB14_08770 [Myxococcota bacterium]